MADWGSAGSVTDKATAGNDLTEPGGEDQYREVLDALNKGKLSVEVCRECCRNILSVAARSKAYEKMLGGKPRATNVIDTENGRAAALAAAEGGMVLLKNENNALPIKENTGIALLGLAAYNPIYGGEGSGGSILQRPSVSKQVFTMRDTLSLTRPRSGSAIPTSSAKDSKRKRLPGRRAARRR